MKKYQYKYSGPLVKLGIIFINLLLLITLPSHAVEGGQAVSIESESVIGDIKRYNLSALHTDEKGISLVFVGTNHTNDPENPQIEGIERLFKKFKPTLVLIEGGNWPVAANKEQAVKRYSELGFTRYLAANANVKAESADASSGDDYNAVLKHYSPSETKLYFALRFVPQWAQQETGLTMDANMTRFLSSPEFTRAFPADAPPRNIKELELLAAKVIPNLKDWRTVQFNLTFDGGKSETLIEIDRVANTFRNAHIEQKIIAGLKQGERVFVISGVTHLAKIMPTLMPKLESIK